MDLTSLMDFMVTTREAARSHGWSLALSYSASVVCEGNGRKGHVK